MDSRSRSISGTWPLKGGELRTAVIWSTRKYSSRPPEAVVQSALMRIQLRQRNIDAITVPTVKTVPFVLSP